MHILTLMASLTCWRCSTIVFLFFWSFLSIACILRSAISDVVANIIHGGCRNDAGSISGLIYEVRIMVWVLTSILIHCPSVSYIHDRLTDWLCDPWNGRTDDLATNPSLFLVFPAKRPLYACAIRSKGPKNGGQYKLRSRELHYQVKVTDITDPIYHEMCSRNIQLKPRISLCYY